MADEGQKAPAGDGKAWPFLMSWVGRVSALIGLFATLAGGVTWLINHHRNTAEHQARMALAASQSGQGEYAAAVKTYDDILSSAPLDRPALDGRLHATMLWVEDFHTVTPEGQSAAGTAAADLDHIFPILDAGLSSAKGQSAADVQAHIGWAHWLNQHIAEREFGSSAEQNFRTALASDPANVYAHAMLGNWMLQNGGSLDEAVQHFNAAVASGRARPFVRKLQLGGLLFLDKKGARAQLVRAANQMRNSGEPLDESNKNRILGFCFDPGVTDHEELAESLAAVPPDDAWKTYLWLDDRTSDGPAHPLVHDFIQANLLEVSGQRAEALQKYRALQQQLKNQPGTMKASVDSGIARTLPH